MIIALSARPYVEAAVKAGFAVTAIDAFADAQTTALAEKSFAVQYGQNGFDAESLIAALDALDTGRFIGFAYGSGFEAQPALLARLAERLPLIGNSPELVAAIKNPARFFAALEQLHIPYPRVSDSIAGSDADDYLLKLVGGTGGTHIRPANARQILPAAQYYYQQKIVGSPLSILFLADKQAIAVIGFNEQWLHPSADAPYRYGGAVSHTPLPQAVKAQLVDAAQKLTHSFGLVGLNSLDAIVTADNRVFVLEINPRLSATVDLYHYAQPDLLRWHVQVCLRVSNLNPQPADTQSHYSHAHAIVYATQAMMLTEPLPWPEWVVDTPSVDQLPLKISAGDPVCTVIAEAEHAAAAKKLAQCRVAIVENLLQSKHI